MSRPAPASSTSDSATSATTSALRSRLRRKPPLMPLPESFSGLDDVAPCRLQRGHQAEDDRRQTAARQAEQQHRHVQADHGFARD